MQSSILFLFGFLISKALADGIAATTTFDPTATQSITSVETNGFNDNNVNTSAPQESWLKQHDRYVFIIVLVLLVVGILIWYIVRSIRGMRKRLATDNQGQMMMMQSSNFPERVPVDNNGFQKMPDYTTPSQQEQQQSYSHRY
jgi:flagellar biosynthesis/type III secretory pathway M-ring protein FliF/YscJ